MSPLRWFCFNWLADVGVGCTLPVLHPHVICSRSPTGSSANEEAAHECVYHKSAATQCCHTSGSVRRQLTELSCLSLRQSLRLCLMRIRHPQYTFRRQQVTVGQCEGTFRQRQLLAAAKYDPQPLLDFQAWDIQWCPTSLKTLTPATHVKNKTKHLKACIMLQSLHISHSPHDMGSLVISCSPAGSNAWDHPRFLTTA